MLRLFQLTALLLLLITSCQPSDNKTDVLLHKIEQIVSDKNAVVGVSIIGNEGKDIISLHGDRRFPMQSVFKFHIALAVLSEIDQGKLSLDQEIEVSKDELLPEDFWSPLRDENPDGGSFTIERLIQYSVSHSDNTACDVLIRLIGTPGQWRIILKRIIFRTYRLHLMKKICRQSGKICFKTGLLPKPPAKRLNCFMKIKTIYFQKAVMIFSGKQI